MFEVMIVDDMEITRMELKRFKIWGEHTGFIISDEAKNGKEALEKLQEHPVDLIITDIRMPVMDGIDLLKELNNKNFNSCVIFLSEYAEFEYARQGLVYGAFDYIVKPIDTNKLEILLKKASKHLNEIKINEEKFETLQGKLKEKIETLYSYEDMGKVIRLFKDIDSNVVEMASSLIETTGAAINYDSIKMAYILNKASVELFEALDKYYPWLSKLVNIPEYTNTDFTKCTNFSDIRTITLKLTHKLIETIKKYEFGNEVGSIVRHVCKIVLTHIDSEISAKAIADDLFLNNSYLSTLFKEKTGSSIVEYITMVKMERAKILLTNNDFKNYEIAYKLGYKDADYFSKLFKKYTGHTPSGFKANCTYDTNI